MNKLPAELMLSILCNLADIESLRSVTSSIPTASKVFVAHRREVLIQVICNELPREIRAELEILHDLSKGSFKSFTRTDEDFIDPYIRQCIFHRSVGTNFVRQDEQDMMKIVRLHLLLGGLVPFLAGSAMKNRPKINGTADEILTSEAPLSVSESLRFYRALCHLEFVSSLCPSGPNIPRLSDRWQGNFHGLLHSFEP